MSREQWGAGYWQGVEDARNGKVRTNIEALAGWCVCLMRIDNEKKSYDRTLFPVAQLVAYFQSAGLDKSLVKAVYDYIMRHEPYGCYIGGFFADPWYEDYFVLPWGRVEEYEKERDRLGALLDTSESASDAPRAR